MPSKQHQPQKRQLYYQQEPAHLLRRLVASETGCWVVRQLIEKCPSELAHRFAAELQDALRQMGSWAAFGDSDHLPSSTAIQLLRQKFTEEMSHLTLELHASLASSFNTGFQKETPNITAAEKSWSEIDLEALAISESGLNIRSTNRRAKQKLKRMEKQRRQDSFNDLQPPSVIQWGSLSAQALDNGSGQGLGRLSKKDEMDSFHHPVPVFHFRGN